VVFSDKYVTGAGVSAGIDMALRLIQEMHGDEFAQAIQLGIEYDPQPPFDSGSPEKADPAIVNLVRVVQTAQDKLTPS
jgi:transcriptional regulator GlxA family with amidase domain